VKACLLEQKVLKIKADSPDSQTIKAIVATLKRGGLVAFPTDTVYGLGGLAVDQSRRRLQNLKGREPARPLGVFVATIPQARKLVSEIPSHATRLMRTFWPGPLTLILRSSNRLPKTLLHQGTIGIRIPNQKWLLLVLRKLRKPMLQTSANISGQPEARNCAEIIKTFGNELDLIVDGGRIKRTRPSTVLDVSGSVPIILRAGAISKTRLERTLRRKIYAGPREI